MASKRVLFRTLADESLANARRLFADAKRLKRAGSRGHAIALAVLSIEESAKALLYREAAEGVLRIVKKNPNHVTTFTEGELLDHRFKHGLLANAFVEWMRYGPFYEVAEGLTKPSYSRTKVGKYSSQRSMPTGLCRSTSRAEARPPAKSSAFSTSWSVSTL